MNRPEATNLASIRQTSLKLAHNGLTVVAGADYDSGRDIKARFILFRRAGIYYCEDTTTRKQSSLKTRSEQESLTLLNARNESFRQPLLNIQIARAYLIATDPAMSNRTWQAVMDQMSTHGKPGTQIRRKVERRIHHRQLIATVKPWLFRICIFLSV